MRWKELGHREGDLTTGREIEGVSQGGGRWAASYGVQQHRKDEADE